MTKQAFRFEYDIIDNCNLNCAGYSHYAPIGDNDCLCANAADKELKLLSNIIEDDCDIIHIMGGEPLLNPNLIDILKIARKYFPRAEIQVITNGILLADMNPSFWKACNELNIVICLTIYPIKLKIDKIIAFSNTFHVKVVQFRNGKFFTRYLLDERGNQNIDHSYNMCNLKECVLYRNGKLYPCTLTGCVYKLNKHFNKTFEITNNDFIEIEAGTTKDDIFTFLNKPIPFCRYCMASKWKDKECQYEWSVSKKESKEWINE